MAIFESLILENYYKKNGWESISTFENPEKDCVDIKVSKHDSETNREINLEYSVSYAEISEIKDLSIFAFVIIGKHQKAMIELLLNVLPDSDHKNDSSWDWCWEELSSEAQEEVKKVRRIALEILREEL